MSASRKRESTRIRTKPKARQKGDQMEQKRLTAVVSTAHALFQVGENDLRTAGVSKDCDPTITRQKGSGVRNTERRAKFLAPVTDMRISRVSGGPIKTIESSGLAILPVLPKHAGDRVSHCLWTSKSHSSHRRPCRCSPHCKPGRLSQTSRD